jgi:hypothetical protein
MEADMDTITISGRATILSARTNRFGYLTTRDLERIATDPETKLTLILVRTGSGRFLTPAQDAKHFIDLIEHAELPEELDHEQDYVRDISVPLNTEIRGEPKDPTLGQMASWLERRDVFPTTLKYIKQAQAIAQASDFDEA